MNQRQAQQLNTAIAALSSNELKNLFRNLPVDQQVTAIASSTNATPVKGQ